MAALASHDPVRALRALGVRWLLVAPTAEAPGWTAGAGTAQGDGTWRWFDLASG